MSLIVYTISVLIQLFIIVVGLYHVLVGLFAFIEKPKNELKSIKHHKFALVVAAHNEQRVIGPMIDSLKNINYDNDKFDIFVIADNCTDRTAEIAKNHGANVFERESSDKRGKGFALEWMFSKIFKMEKQYDAICVFDADNIVHPDFLNKINLKFNEGFKAVQGYIDTKNPNDSWITASYAVTFWCINKLYQTARSNLGLSNQICGTGFAVSVDIIKEFGWGATCLAEDMEFTTKLILNNISVGWAADAIVYDEKPLTLSQSFKQRTRWMQGHSDVASRFFVPLIKKAFREKDILAFDCAIYLVQPLLLILLLIVTLMSLAQLLVPSLSIWFLTNLAIPPYLWNLILFIQLAFTPLLLWHEKKLTKKIMMYYIPYLFFTYTWMPIAIIGVAKRNDKVWFHTEHTRKISITEIE